MLKYELVVPEGVRDGAPLLVLLHGVSRDRHELREVGTQLAPGSIVVTPEGPYDAEQWAEGTGRMWYERLTGLTAEPNTFEAAQQALGALLAELPSRLPVRAGPLVLGGLSQGGAMAVGYALRNPGTVPMVLCLNSFVPAHASVRVTPETARGARIFWGVGFMDIHVQMTQSEPGREALVRAGAAVERRMYPTGYGIGPNEARDIREWIERGGAPFDDRLA